jgi:succinate-semialdehyde dehydrogenase/glutarate-semialdehyde dehydrogenase
VADRVPLDSLLATEESFGPVVPVITADSEDELIGIANSDPLGLQAAVFTQNIGKAYRFVEELAVGQVVVNDSTCWWDINMPFGGAGGRRTGWGRIGGKHTLLGMTDLRTAAIQLLPLRRRLDELRPHAGQSQLRLGRSVQLRGLIWTRTPLSALLTLTKC